MNADHRFSTEDSATTTGEVQLNVVILHDGVVSARRATDVVNFVSDSLGQGSDVQCLTREFADLERASLWKELLARATSADLLVIATRHDAELPEPVRSLLVSWSVHGPAPGAMVIGLIESECSAGEVPPGAWWYLDLVSRQAGVPLLVRAYPPGLDAAPPIAPAESSRLMERQSA